MSICAGLILPVIFAPLIPNNWITGTRSSWPGFNYGMWMAAILIGVAAAAHQGFSANIFTTTSDMFPKREVSSVVGMGGLAGALGGMIMQAVAGVIKEVTHSYLVMFIIAGTVYVLAVVIFHLLAPRLQKVDEKDLESQPMPYPVTAVLGAVSGFVLGVPLSFLFQPHATGMAASFGLYTSSIITGDIFKESHSPLMFGLVCVPLVGAGILAMLSIAMHAMVRSQHRDAPAIDLANDQPP